MHCTALVQATQGGPEVAIIQLEGTDHHVLHDNPLAFVNDNHVFRKPVSKVEIAPHSKVTPTQVIVAHLPNCTCYAYCLGM